MMNEVNIKKFLEQTEEYLKNNQQDMSPQELDNITELYDDLSHELQRQQLVFDLYH